MSEDDSASESCLLFVLRAALHQAGLPGWLAAKWPADCTKAMVLALQNFQSAGCLTLMGVSSLSRPPHTAGIVVKVYVAEILFLCHS